MTEGATTRPACSLWERGVVDLCQIALANLPHGLCMFDRDKRLILCNPAYAGLYDLPPTLTRAGVARHAIHAYRKAIGNAPAAFATYFNVEIQALEQGRHATSRVPLEDGRVIQITHNPMADGGYVATHEDVTAHVRTEARILYLATHDHLTGLLNRSAFCDRIESLSGARERGGLVAVHYLDLDRFKAVNDTFGHHAGDQLMATATRRLQACVGPDDVVGRLGGDEFAVLQVGLARREDAGALASRLIEAIGAPFDCAGRPVTIGLSIGIATAAAVSMSAGDLLREADAALYSAKLDGRNVFRFAAENPAAP